MIAGIVSERTEILPEQVVNMGLVGGAALSLAGVYTLIWPVLAEE